VSYQDPTGDHQPVHANLQADLDEVAVEEVIIKDATDKETETGPNLDHDEDFTNKEALDWNLILGANNSNPTTMILLRKSACRIIAQVNFGLLQAHLLLQRRGLSKSCRVLCGHV
jgi:hypothetical protein